MSDLFVAIVGGTISTVVGGIILALIRPMMGNRYTPSYSFDAQGCTVTLFKLLVIGLANTIAIAVLWGSMKSAEMDFGMPGFGQLIKLFLLLIMNVALYAKLFFGIDLIVTK